MELSEQVQAAASDSSATQSTPAQPWSSWGMIKTMAFRLMVTYFIINLFRRPQQPANPNQSADKLVPSTNMYGKGSPMEMYAYLSDQSDLTGFNLSDVMLFWHEPELVYGDWSGGVHGDGSFTKDDVIDCHKFPNLMNNGSLYLHVYVVKRGFSPDPVDGNRYSKKWTMQKTRLLTRHKRRRLSRTTNLLTGQTGVHPDLIANDSTPSDVSYLPPSTHWHQNLTINLIDDYTAWTVGMVPEPLNEHVQFYEPTNEYYPVLFFNDYWNLNEDYKPINQTTPSLRLSLTLSPLSLFKFQLYAAQMSKKSFWAKFMGDASLGGETESEEGQDTLKRALVETNPYLLAVTVVVSLLHTVFELLAFKNDIQFWKTRESLEGLSVRSVFFNVFQSLIVLLYVLDNDTNFVIIMSVFMSLAIEVWKIKKVLIFRVDWTNPLVQGVIPRIHYDYKASYVESDTKKYDQMAFKYLSWLLFPLLAAFCGYSLMYEEHRGWYSWVLSMLYGFLLTFGFIMMTPQLFINYKLKSVAHLPWRMLTYKALNTFIDDLFAFVIYMPTLYRIGCLRDDVIFFIYLYQRWIYPMDPNRVNEFGVSKEMLDNTNLLAMQDDAAAIQPESTDAAADVQPDDNSPSVRRRNVPTASE